MVNRLARVSGNRGICSIGVAGLLTGVAAFGLALGAAAFFLTEPRYINFPIDDLPARF